MSDYSTYVAMDTHKEEHRVAVVYSGTGELQEFTVKNTIGDITKMVKRIQKHSAGKVRFCYEAGVCGFTLKRRIESLGGACSVIAPSLVPTKAGRADQDGSAGRQEAAGALGGGSIDRGICSGSSAGSGPGADAGSSDGPGEPQADSPSTAEVPDASRVSVQPGASLDAAASGVAAVFRV